MEDKKLFLIGEVAKMFHISMGTLRHYEQAGLLEPEYTDPDTAIMVRVSSNCSIPYDISGFWIFHFPR